jgi:hypothetical protein
MKETPIEICIDLLFMLVCAALGITIWGGLIRAIDWLIPIERPYLWGAGLMLLLNTGHYIWGLFHTDDDISDIPTRGMMTNYWDYHRVGIRIAAFLTIGPSIYLRRAVERHKSSCEEEDP